MKTKYVLITTLVCGAALVWWMLDHQQGEQRASAARRVEEVTTVAAPPIEKREVEDVAAPRQGSAKVEERTYQISPANIAFNPDAQAKSKEAEPFRLLGENSGAAKIIDKSGNIVLEADPKVGIYGCNISPSDKYIAVYFASEGSIILEPETGAKILLPKRPAGENTFVFGRWYWIDDDTLVAESGDEKLDGNGKPVRSEANGGGEGVSFRKSLLQRIGGDW